MARTASPLRYPGGKSCLLGLTSTILDRNGISRGHYVEPFAGGCGLALSLLYGGHVAEIHINDLDPAVWAFWRCVLEDTDTLIAKIAATPVTIDEWYKQREIHRAQDVTDPTPLGFAAFFLNRTNRSGIIKDGGAIGGLEQTGNYKIDCRFNVDDLSRRIARVAKYRDRIHLSNLDASVFLSTCNTLPDRSFLFIDPPYFKKGPGLYTSFYRAEDHSTLAQSIMRLNLPWAVTYDDVPEIRGLYRTCRQFTFDIHYSAHQKRLGTELLIASKGLRIGAHLALRPCGPSSEAA
ncbi:MAG: adenine methylase [Sphingomonadales bacterium]|nr:adenine methylase [Sphingomonadales bacterium]